MIVCVSLGEADAVRRLGRSDDDFLNAEFASGFDYIVGASDVGLEEF